MLHATAKKSHIQLRPEAAKYTIFFKEGLLFLKTQDKCLLFHDANHVPWNPLFMFYCSGIYQALHFSGETEPKQKQHPVVDVTGDGSKVWCCREQYCIGTWNVRSMNQGKLEVVKQEMARVNVNILGIGKLKWTGMGEFNSHDHYIYYCRHESLRRNGVAMIVNKRVWNAVLGCNLKNDRMISVRLQGQLFNTVVIEVNALTSNAEEAEWFYEDL